MARKGKDIGRVQFQNSESSEFTFRENKSNNCSSRNSNFLVPLFIQLLKVRCKQEGCKMHPKVFHELRIKINLWTAPFLLILRNLNPAQETHLQVEIHVVVKYNLLSTSIWSSLLMMVIPLNCTNVRSATESRAPRYVACVILSRQNQIQSGFSS